MIYGPDKIEQTYRSDPAQAYRMAAMNAEGRANDSRKQAEEQDELARWYRQQADTEDNLRSMRICARAETTPPAMAVRKAPEPTGDQLCEPGREDMERPVSALS